MIKGAEGFGLLQSIPRGDFKMLCKKWNIDKGVRQLPTWKLLETLVLSFVAKLGSLREIEDVLFVPRSSLSDACRTRSYGFFQELADLVLKQIYVHENRRKLRSVIRDILGIDSTECRVHGSLFRFVNWRSGDKKASTKLHVVWNIDKQWISDIRVTSGRASDLTVAKKFKLQSGKTYVFDRAYVDLKFWLAIKSSGSHFVTRLKRAPRKDAVHKAILSKEDLNKTGVLFDGEWNPSDTACYRLGLKSKELTFRHVIYRDPKSGKLFDFITSDRDSSALEIAGIYKKRWSIELLFRWLKGHLNIRYLGMKNLNAIKLLLSVAVLVQLLIRLKMLVDEYKGTAWECLRDLRSYISINGLKSVAFINPSPPDPTPKPEALGQKT